MFMSVDLPEPLDPMIATNSPFVTSSDTPRSAWTAASPLAYVLWTSCTEMTPITNLADPRRRSRPHRRDPEVAATFVRTTIARSHRWRASYRVGDPLRGAR